VLSYEVDDFVGLVRGRMRLDKAVHCCYLNSQSGESALIGRRILRSAHYLRSTKGARV